MVAVFFSAAFFASVHGAIWITLRRGLPAWWGQRVVRVLFAALAAASLVLAIWYTASVTHEAGLGRFAIHLFRASLTLALPVALTLPVSAVAVRLLSPKRAPRELAIEKRVEPANEKGAAPDAPVTPEAARSSEAPNRAMTRRRFIHAGSAALPTAALSLSAGGLVMAQEAQRLPIVPMKYAGLPPDLQGLKILHLSDLHLGYFMHVPELRACLARAAALAPDLIVFTGDIADDLDQLGPAMEVAAEMNPRLGVFAAVGNHEHFRGISRVRRIFDRSKVPLLFEEGRTLQVGSARLHIAGSDDPVSLRSDPREFLKAAIDRAFDGAPSDAFHLLLSHRPEGFDVASAMGIDLTLSGHTHGAQIGMNGRSLFESSYPEKYLWGAYERGKSRLYTSSGFGHWFPIRLNCPTEAPLITLERA